MEVILDMQNMLILDIVFTWSEYHWGYSFAKQRIDDLIIRLPNNVSMIWLYIV